MSWIKITSSNDIVSKLGESNGELTFNGFKVDKITTTATQQSKWANKVWNCLGDSITEMTSAGGTQYYGYHEYIKDWIGCTVNNYGISGTGWFTPSSSGGTNAFYQRVSSMAENADLITVFGGTNDWGQTGKTLVLGTLGDTATSTFYGAVDNTIQQLIAKYPTKTIAVFTPLPRNLADTTYGTNATNTLDQVADAIIKVCNKYSIPVLDLYRVSNMNPSNATFRAAQMSDGLHPTKDGMKRIAEKMLSFLNSL